MVSPDRAERPKQVVWAYRCWVTSGVLLVVMGVLLIVLGVTLTGPTLGPVGIGFIVAVVGAAYNLLGSRAYTGDARWRSSLSALTLVMTALLLFVSFGVPILAFALLASLVGLFGSLLAYRPDSEAWFTGTPQKK